MDNHEMNDVPVNLRAVQKQEAARGAANSMPFPGALADAFAGEEIRVGDIVLRPVVLGDYITLRRIGNPMHEWLKSMGANANMTLDIESLMEIVLLFRTPAREADALSKRGKEAFREAAMEQDLSGMPFGAINELMVAIFKNFERSISTNIAHRPQSSGGGDADFTKGQPGDAMTASAGGSTLRAS